MSHLTLGECKVLLLSDSIKYFRDLKQFTMGLRASGDNVVKSIDSLKTLELNRYLSTKDRKKARKYMGKEWAVTDVEDLGIGVRGVCEYCGHRKIRYRYQCKNRTTGSRMYVGSSCVDFILHGEEKMRSENLDRTSLSSFGQKEQLKLNLFEQNSPTKSDTESQFRDIHACVQFLSQYGITIEHSSLLQEIKQYWDDFSSVPDNLMNALFGFCRKIKNVEKVQ